MFVTKAGKLTTEACFLRPHPHANPLSTPRPRHPARDLTKKKQVVETTCGSHEKTSKDNL